LVVVCYREKVGYYSGKYFFEDFSILSMIAGTEYDVTDVVGQNHREKLKDWAVEKLNEESEERAGA
jgi:hypothetical protein